MNYVYGNGNDVYIDTGKEEWAEWAEYMMDNETLTTKTEYYLYPIALNMQPGETKEIDIEIPMIIDSTKDQKTGYMLLYGSNENVGNYQIKGMVSRDSTGAATYDLTYTFNDIMDPEFKYASDRKEYNQLRFLKEHFDNSITMNDYNIHISWSDTTVFHYARSNEQINEGWLAGMEKLHINNMRNMINAVKKKYDPESEAYGTAMLTEEFLNGYIKYINEHPEYYGCILE